MWPTPSNLTRICQTVRTLLAAAVPAASALVVTLPSTTTAQQPPTLSVGQSVSGRLAATDPQLADGIAFHVYRLDLRQGERVSITMRSSDFDAYLQLLRPVGGITEPLAEDDDSAGDTDARLRFTAPAPGTYYVVARTFASNSHGSYTLAVEAAPVPEPRPITAGQPVTDTLDQDEVDWVYHGQAGERLVITMASVDFDTVLAIGRMIEGRFDLLADNDDDEEADTTDSRVVITLPATGAYLIRAGSFVSAGSGRYTLRVERQ